MNTAKPIGSGAKTFKCRTKAPSEVHVVQLEQKM